MQGDASRVWHFVLGTACLALRVRNFVFGTSCWCVGLSNVSAGEVGIGWVRRRKKTK